MMYEEGRYLCECTGQGIGETRSAKLPQLWVGFMPAFRLLSGGEREVVEDAEKRSASRALTNRDGEVTEEMQKYLAADLKAIGFSGELEDFVPGSDNFFDCKSNEFVAKCSHREFDGKTHENWQIEWNGGGQRTAGADSATVSQLSALYSTTMPKSNKKATEAASERF